MRPGSQSWDAVAKWYAGHAGPEGSIQHRHVAIPLMMALLTLRAGETVVDLGCGPGVLTPAVVRAGGRLTGVDLSPKLIAAARRHHGRRARFIVADVTRKDSVVLQPAGFDAAAFLLSLQDIDPLDGAIETAAALVKPGGRIAIVLTHPCFRAPRQSGWGWDEGRALQFRRVDSYLGRMVVPVKPYGDGRSGSTCSYHRPLADYVAALAGNGFAVTMMREAAGVPKEGSSRAMRRAMAEIPMFLGLRAERIG